MPRKPLSVRLDEELLTRVRAAADERGQKVTTFVERALESALAPTWNYSPEMREKIRESLSDPIMERQQYAEGALEAAEAKIKAEKPKSGPPSIASTWRR